MVDSLYREYPSGLILLWKPRELPELRNTALDENSGRTPDFLILVLDGQQRLTSLAKVFNGEIDVYFNVEEESFQIYSPKLKANPLWISVKEAVREGAVNIWMKLQQALASQVEQSKLHEYLQRLSSLKKLENTVIPS